MSVPASAHAQEPAPEPPFSVEAPSQEKGATVARLLTPTFARTRLSSGERGRRLSTATSWSAQPQVLLVLEARTFEGRDWVKLLLPNRPNGSAGWVPRDHVALGQTRYWISVRLRARRVTVYRDGKRVRAFRAVVGARATPTPLGLAAIYERNRQPNARAFLGPWVLSLTSLSNVLESYGGGPGRVAIHGRSGASLRDPLGSARSHGCIRVNNRDVRWLAARIPAGTPVRVSR
jgi:lipoprotein-anchoring transpeptidase ErfK/SrfK